MNELVTITEFQKLRQKFHKETGMYAIKHKIEYTHWLEQELVNNINYTHSCTELRDKEAPNIEDWLKDNFKRLDRHSFTNTHEDTIWLRSELVEVYNQLHP